MELPLLRKMAEEASIWGKDLQIHIGHVKFHMPSEDPIWMLNETLNIRVWSMREYQARALHLGCIDDIKSHETGDH